MRLKISDDFDSEIKAISESAKIPPNEVVNLLLSRYLDHFKAWLTNKPDLSLPLPTQPVSTAKLIDVNDLPPMEF